MATVNVRDGVFSPESSRTVAITDLVLTEVTAADLVARVLHALRATHASRNADFVLRTVHGILLPSRSVLYDCGVRGGTMLVLEREGSDSRPLLLDARVVRESSLERGADAARRSTFQLDVVLQEKSGRPVFRIEGNELPACSIGDVKRLIQESCRVPASELRMMVGNRMRCDDEQLGVCLGSPSNDGSVAAVRVYEKRLTLSIFVAETGKTVQVHGLLPSDTVASVWKAVAPTLDPEAASEDASAPDASRRRKRKITRLATVEGTPLADETVLGTLRKANDGGVIRVVFDAASARRSPSPRRQRTPERHRSNRPSDNAPEEHIGPEYELRTTVNSSGHVSTAISSRKRTQDWINARAEHRTREIQPLIADATHASESAKRVLEDVNRFLAAAGVQRNAIVQLADASVLTLEAAEAIAYDQHRAASPGQRSRQISYDSTGSVAVTSVEVGRNTLEDQLDAFKQALLAERRGNARPGHMGGLSSSRSEAPLVVSLM